MNKTNVLLLLTLLIVLSSCYPKVTTSLKKTYPALDYKQEIAIIGLNEAEPDNFEFLGQVKIGDTGFSNKCGYDIVIKKAKLEARKVGGNVLKIIIQNPGITGK